MACVCSHGTGRCSPLSPDEVRSVGGLAMARTLDVTDESAVGDAVGAVLASWGRIDVLVTRAVVPGMIAAGGGRVINLNSGGGTAERAELSAYSASKSALAL